MSRPGLYGGFGGYAQDKDNKPSISRRNQRHRMNIVPVYQCLFLPWLLYCAIFALMSSSANFYRPYLCYALLAIAALGVLALGWTPLKILLGRAPTTSGTNWYGFFFVTMAIALVLGAVFGNLNFSTTMIKYYEYENLDIFTEASPLFSKGEQLMDAGRVMFGNNSVLDTRRSMGFKNMDTYCVAPISIVQSGVTMPLQTYDFWAVGLNCCSSNAADFSCGEYANQQAHSGLRFLGDSQRDFFRLAVQEATAAYGIKAEHPLFFYWVQDPTAEMDSFKQEGYKYFLIGMLSHFAWQSLCVGLAIAAFAKLGYA